MGQQTSVPVRCMVWKIFSKPLSLPFGPTTRIESKEAENLLANAEKLSIQHKRRQLHESQQFRTELIVYEISGKYWTFANFLCKKS